MIGAEMAAAALSRLEVGRSNEEFKSWGGIKHSSPSCKHWKMFKSWFINPFPSVPVLNIQQRATTEPLWVAHVLLIRFHSSMWEEHLLFKLFRSFVNNLAPRNSTYLNRKFLNRSNFGRPKFSVLYNIHIMIGISTSWRDCLLLLQHAIKVYYSTVYMYIYQGLSECTCVSECLLCTSYVEINLQLKQLTFQWN